MKNKIKLLLAAACAVAVTTSAQTNLAQVPNLLGTNNWVDQQALNLGVPQNSQLDIAAGVSYAPSFHSGDKIGYWFAGTYATATNSLLAYEFGIYDMKLNQKDTLLYPSGLLLLRHTWCLGPMAITPLVEAGAAIDGKFQDPYGTTGVGLDVGWHEFSLVIGVERWTGPRNNMTVAKAGVAYSMAF
jgi:hypothetical protein